MGGINISIKLVCVRGEKDDGAPSVTVAFIVVLFMINGIAITLRL